MTDKNKAEAKNVIRLSLPVKFKIVSEEKSEGEKGIIEAYVSIFNNVDLVGDIIEQGAFAESLAKKLPKGVWSHNWDLPIAKTLIAKEDEKGLYIKGQFNLDTQRGAEAYSDVKFGTIDEFSIGFRILDDEWREDGIRVIKKARLYEWSPVLVGANPDTELLDVKSEEQEKEKKEVEKETETEEEKVEEETEEKNMRKVTGVIFNHKESTIELLYKEDGEEKSEKLEVSEELNKNFEELYQTRKTKVASKKGEGEATPSHDRKTVLRIRQVAKQQKKASEYLLKITK